MTAEELHIDLDIQVQKINSNATVNIDKFEKDIFLNQQVARYLNSVTRDISNLKRKGFEEDTKRLKDIEPLIRNEELEVEEYGTEYGRFFLPSSVFKYVSARPQFYKDCEAVEVQEQNKTFNIVSFTIPRTITGTYTISIKIAGIVTILFDSATLPDNSIWEDRSYMIKAILIKLQELTNGFLKDNNIKWYYEWCGSQYKENTFFFMGASNSFSDILIGGTTRDLDDGTTKVSRAFKTFSADKVIKRPGRLTSHERLDWMLSSSISGSIQESPIITVDKSYGYAYHPKNTIINRVGLTYICKPNLIDILLGTSLNLDSDICQEIVINTAKFIKALLDSGNYEKYFNETNLIE